MKRNKRIKGPFEMAARAVSFTEVQNKFIKEGDHFMTLKEYPKALTSYRKAINTGSIRAYRNLGELYLLGWGVDKSPQKALECWQRVYEDPREGSKNRDLTLRIAVCYDTLENPEEALKYYELYHSFFDTVQAHEYLVEFYQKHIKAGFMPAQKVRKQIILHTTRLVQLGEERFVPVLESYIAMWPCAIFTALIATNVFNGSETVENSRKRKKD